MARGGKRENAGRKSINDEAKANQLFIRALKEIHDVETDDEAKIEFIKNQLMQSQRGHIFIAEHIFGKPKETIDQNHTFNSFDIKEIINFDKSE